MNDKYVDLVEGKHKESYLKYMKGGNADTGRSSHQPVLIHILNTITKGDVLEFGVGIHSTPLMHAICEKQKRNLLSIETDLKWLNKFNHYRSNFHSLEFVTPNELGGNHHIYNKKYAVALIDGITSELRQIVSERITADYIIVHDTEFFAAKKHDPDRHNYDFSMFKYVGHFRFFEIGTSVLSNLDEINKEIADMLTS